MGLIFSALFLFEWFIHFWTVNEEKEDKRRRERRRMEIVDLYLPVFVLAS